MRMPLCGAVVKQHLIKRKIHVILYNYNANFIWLAVILILAFIIVGYTRTKYIYIYIYIYIISWKGIGPQIACNEFRFKRCLQFLQIQLHHQSFNNNSTKPQFSIAPFFLSLRSSMFLFRQFSRPIKRLRYLNYYGLLFPFSSF